VSERILRQGRVVDAAGEPVSGALVAVVWGTAPTPEIARRTDDAGAFQVGFPPGRFRVQATTPSGGTGELEVEGGSGEEIVIRIESPERSA
jgi:hypothetical protein